MTICMNRYMDVYLRFLEYICRSGNTYTLRLSKLCQSIYQSPLVSMLCSKLMWIPIMQEIMQIGDLIMASSSM